MTRWQIGFVVLVGQVLKARNRHKFSRVGGLSLVEGDEEIVRSTLRGFNRAIILWLVSKAPMPGSTTVKELERLTEQKFHKGTVYPLLYEMEKKGLLKSAKTCKGRSHTKNYEITESGLKLLNHLRSVMRMPVKEVMEDLINEKT